jgi:transcriptional regulator with XRE-family HTH domain
MTSHSRAENALRRYRLAADKSQLQLMKETGLHYSTISRIERGWQAPSRKQAELLSAAVGGVTELVFPGFLDGTPA